MKNGTQKQCPWYLGFGLVWAVEYSLYSSNNLFSVVGFTRAPNDLFNIGSLVAIIVTCVTAALLFSKKSLEPCEAQPRTPTVLSIIGLLMVALTPELSGDSALLVLAVAGAVSGIGFALQVVIWQSVLAGSETRTSASHVAATFLLGAVICTILQLLPYPLALILSLASLLGAYVLLRRSHMPAKSSNTAGTPSGQSDPSKQIKRTITFIGTILFFVCVLEALYTSCSQISFSTGQGFAASNLAFNSSIVIASAALFFLFRKAKESPSSLPLYDIVFFVVGAALAALPFLGTDYGLSLGMLVIGCLHIAYVVLIVTTIETVRELDARAISVFSIVEACVRFASLLGVILATSLFREDIGFLQLALLSFASLYVLGIALVVVLRRSRIHETAQQAGPTVESLAVATLGADEKNELMKLAKDILEARCKELCEWGGLTNREGDVLLCLAQGNSIAKTSEILAISLNTVKTHAKMVYVKLDVHTRQELSDLIQAE